MGPNIEPCGTPLDTGEDVNKSTSFVSSGKPNIFLQNSGMTEVLSNS